MIYDPLGIVFFEGIILYRRDAGRGLSYELGDEDQRSLNHSIAGDLPGIHALPMVESYARLVK